MEPKISKDFEKAVDTYKASMVAYQELQKKFVAEKDAKKKESMKSKLVSAHKKMKADEVAFEKMLKATEDWDSVDENAKSTIKEFYIRKEIRKVIKHELNGKQKRK